MMTSETMAGGHEHSEEGRRLIRALGGGPFEWTPEDVDAWAALYPAAQRPLGAVLLGENAHIEAVCDFLNSVTAAQMTCTCKPGDGCTSCADPDDEAHNASQEQS